MRQLMPVKKKKIVGAKSRQYHVKLRNYIHRKMEGKASNSIISCVFFKKSGTTTLFLLAVEYSLPIQVIWTDFFDFRY